jgi:hypothetical protein
MISHPEVTSVIVWEIAQSGLLSWISGDSAARAPGDGWFVVSDEYIASHSYWDWQDGWVFRRREFHRKSSAN